MWNLLHNIKEYTGFVIVIVSQYLLGCSLYCRKQAESDSSVENAADLAEKFAERLVVLNPHALLYCPSRHAPDFEHADGARFLVAPTMWRSCPGHCSVCAVHCAHEC